VLHQYVRNKQSNTLKGNLVGFEYDDQQFYSNSRISLEMLCQNTFMESGKIGLVLEKLFGLIQVTDTTPLGYSQQYEGCQYIPC